MIHKPLSASDALKSDNVIARLSDWLTKKTNVVMSNHLFPTIYG